MQTIRIHAHPILSCRIYITAALIFLQSVQVSHAQSIDRCTQHEYRQWWDVLHYDLDIAFDLAGKQMSGTNTITALVTMDKQSVLQVDLQSPLTITKAQLWHQPSSRWQDVAFDTIEHGVLVMIPFAPYSIGDTFRVKVHYSGTPTIAKNAPWDGGMVYTKDKKGNHFVGVACQGAGASIWYPLKDVLADEPQQGMTMTYSVPAPYTVIGNGHLIRTTKDAKKKTNTYTYRVQHPINSYGVSFYIGRYAQLESGPIRPDSDATISFHHLSYRQAEAQRLLSTIPDMVRSIERWCGAYPFPADGISFVEAPYLGMEHQSAIAYGNDYKPGYKGADRSGSGVGLLFDFLALHELGHEWYGNSISTANPCDMWINEGFTSYL